MAATIASSTSCQNRPICKSNIKSNVLDRRNPMHTHPNIRSVNQVPAVSKSNLGYNQHKSEKALESNESQKTRPVFRKNDLVWAKLKNHPWWPCRILNEIVNKIGENCIYFVELIGANSERDWVSDGNIFKYAGIDSFKTYAQDQVDKATSKFAKEELAERFQLKIATNKREEWDRAIKQADFIRNQAGTGLNQNRIEKRKREKLNFKEKQDSNRLSCNNVQNNNFPVLSVIEEKVKKSKQNENNFREKIDYNNNNLNCKKMETLSDEENNCEEEQEEEDNGQNTTLTSLLNEQKNMVERLNKTRVRKPRPEVWTSNIVKSCDENELKLKIKLNNIAKKDEENLSDDEFVTSPRRRSKSNSSTSSRSSSSSTSSSSSCSSSDSSSGSSTDTNGLESLPKIKKKLSPASSTWSDYEPNNSFPRNLSDSVVEKINLKKQNARKSSASFCLSSPTPSLPTPNKRKSNCKQVARKRSSKSLSEQTTIDNSLFDENNLLSSAQNFNESIISNGANGNTNPETYLIDRYKYAVRHIKQGLSVEEACNKYRISKGALLKCLSGGTAPRGKKTRLTESEENEIVEWLISYKDLKYNDAIHLVFEQVAQKFELAQRPNPFNNGKPSMDWWYDFLSRHPQIMASKPDWLKRGKVNDQYIRDVQSGHLKCTKFRRALLSAIQYIKSLNDPTSASILESVTGGASSSQPSSSNQEPKAKVNQKSALNSQKMVKAKSTKAKAGSQTSKKSDEKVAQVFVQAENLERRYNSPQANAQTNMYPNMMLNNSCIINEPTYQANIHNRNNSNCSSTTVTTNSLDYNDEDLSSVSPISLLNSNLTKQDLHSIDKSESLFIDSKSFGKSDNAFSNFVNGHENLSDEDDEECIDNLEDNFEDDLNANVTYHTEIFSPELDDNDFEDLIDPNDLIKKDLNVHSSNMDQTGFINQQIFQETKYSNEMMFNMRYQDPGHNMDPDSFINIRQQSMVYDNQLLGMESITSDILGDRAAYTNLYHNNLNYTEQNSIDDNHRLIHGEGPLICDAMYPSAYLN